MKAPTQLSRRRFLQLGAATGSAVLLAAGTYALEERAMYGLQPVQAGSPSKRGLQNQAVSLLIVYGSQQSGSWSHYLGEILLAEGLPDFAELEEAELSWQLLQQSPLVLLGSGIFSKEVADLLANYVNQGGKLVVMRPTHEIVELCGLRMLQSSLHNGYLHASEGIAARSLQFHGEAFAYELAGAEVVAWGSAQSDQHNPLPLITKRRLGQGEVWAWAYDLASSVVLTRQGNPAWVDQERDGLAGVRASDLFVDWLDLERIAIPQADEQQRLLLYAIQQLHPSPLPRLWYFPDQASAIVALTGDAHGIAAQHIESVLHEVEQFDGQMSVYYTPPSLSTASRIVRKTRWHASRLPFIGKAVPTGSIPTPMQVHAWRARGHEFGMHAFTDAGLAAGYEQYWRAFEQLGYGPLSPTSRTHSVAWYGWVENAKVQAQYGIEMNLDFYHVGSAFRKDDKSWAYGHFTGSGLAMRFMDEQGQLLPVFQQNTQLVDERLLDVFGGKTDGLSASEAALISQQLVNAAVQDYPAVIGMQCHFDPFEIGGERAERLHEWLRLSLQAARDAGVPIRSADYVLQAQKARYASNIRGLRWDSKQLLASFSFDWPSSQSSIEVLIPLWHQQYQLVRIAVDQQSVSYNERVLGTSRFAAVSISSGEHQISAQYAP
jgi:hypothetical protein